MIPWQEMLEMRTRDRKTEMENDDHLIFKNTIVYLKYILDPQNKGQRNNTRRDSPCPKVGNSLQWSFQKSYNF